MFKALKFKKWKSHFLHQVFSLIRRHGVKSVRILCLKFGFCVKFLWKPSRKIKNKLFEFRFRIEFRIPALKHDSVIFFDVKVYEKNAKLNLKCFFWKRLNSTIVNKKNFHSIHSQKYFLNVVILIFDKNILMDKI